MSPNIEWMTNVVSFETTIQATKNNMEVQSKANGNIKVDAISSEGNKTVTISPLTRTLELLREDGNGRNVYT